jgi:hypothetical protein
VRAKNLLSLPRHERHAPNVLKSASGKMRVLVDHSFPFALAHGGFQIQIEQTTAALRQIGVDAEFLRWWDDEQRADVIHYFGRPSEDYLHHAHQKGIKVAMAELLTELGSRSAGQRRVQKTAIRAAQSFLPQSFTTRMSWRAYTKADAVIAGTPWEARLMREMFGAPEARIHVVPNGVELVFFDSPAAPRGSWLVCTATITERKRVLEVAQAAVLARTPIWFLGAPYAASDPYALRFEDWARRHPEWIRYEGPVKDRQRLAGIYREARGFVLLSTMESLSLASQEAAACECPMLLSDLPWARSVFGETASYCPVSASPAETAAALKRFYEAAPHLPVPVRPLTWRDVAAQLAGIYEGLLKSSR